MYARFRYLDGPRSGEFRAVGADFATIGRHPSSEVSFDPEGDLEVSVRHAAVFKQGGAFLIRDLGSTNGTWLNGRRVRGDLPLEPGDVLRFGPTGPRLEFSIAAEPGLPPRSEAAPARPARAEIFGPRTRTTERIRVEVRKQTRPWKWIATLAVVAAIVTASGAAWQARRTQERLASQRTALLSRVDDLLDRLERTQAGAAGIATALSEARLEMDRLRTSIATAGLSQPTLDTLASAVSREATRHAQVINAAALDPASITGQSRDAVAVLIAEFADGSVHSGTAFGVRRSADTTWMATARHLVRDTSGIPAVRLALVFNGTGQAFLASLERTHDTADAAVVRTVIRGGTPVVAGLRDSVAVGDPVALVGFPFGLDSLGDWRRRGVAATGSAGTVRGIAAGELLLEGYGTYGSSGSPVFGADGRVLGFVSGRRREGGELVAVPAAVIAGLFPAPSR